LPCELRTRENEPRREPEDRRKNRTTETLRALARLLDAARRRSGLEALTIADGSGVLLAGAGPARLCDELAAWAPIGDRRPDNDTLPSCLDSLERRTGRHRLALDGFEIVVSTLGDAPELAAEVDQVSAGLRRILAAGGSSV
jgi:hypothetical protein